MNTQQEQQEPQVRVRMIVDLMVKDIRTFNELINKTNKERPTGASWKVIDVRKVEDVSMGV